WVRRIIGHHRRPASIRGHSTANAAAGRGTLVRKESRSPFLAPSRPGFVPPREDLAHCKKRVHESDADDDPSEHLLQRPKFGASSPQRNTQDERRAPQTDAENGPGDVVEKCFQRDLPFGSSPPGCAWFGPCRVTDPQPLFLIHATRTPPVPDA